MEECSNTVNKSDRVAKDTWTIHLVMGKSLSEIAKEARKKPSHKATEES